MPEGPEIRLSVDYLNKRLKGQKIAAMRVCKDGRYKNELSKFWPIYDTKIEEINAKGKMTWWELTNWTSDKSLETLYLVVTYGMTGQWRVIRSSEDDPKHACARITLDRGNGPSYLWQTLHDYVFVDQRHMGTISILSRKEFLQKLEKLGPDMLKKPPTPEVFAERLLKNPARTICEALMDQSVVSGIGNYIKAETLFAARVSPHRKVCDLTAREIIDLRNAACGVMSASIYFGGASFKNHVNVEGREGDAYQHLIVYGKENCVNGHPIIKEETLDKRTTHWCPECQR